jgi:glycosyltransferase involved in cell wall biosynthesis
MSDQPLISIVTPSYNQGRFIKQTLDSILQQDYPYIELIVMDGGSDDETVSVLQQYNDPRLTWRSEKDNGQSDAINKGMRLVKGDVLAYLNSDDIYLPGTLRFVADYFTAHPESDGIYGHCVSLNAQGQEIQPPLKVTPFDPVKAFLKERWRCWQPGFFWRRSVIERIGLFDESLHYAMDYDFWLRMITAGYQLHYVDRFLAGVRYHDTSKTVRHILRFYEEYQRIYAKVYATPRLPDWIARLKPYSYAYLDFRQANTHWRLGERNEARPYLRQVVTSGGPLRLKVMALTMLVDSYLNTSFHKGLQALYWRFTGTKLDASMSIEQIRAAEQT